MGHAKGLTFHQFVVRVGDWGGYAVIETDNLADIHVLTTALAVFTFRLEPVIDVMDAVAIELEAMAWRESLDVVGWVGATTDVVSLHKAVARRDRVGADQAPTAW